MSQCEKDTVATPHECYICGSPADLCLTRERWLCPDHWETHIATGGTPETNAKAAQESRERLAGCVDAC